MNEKDRAEAAVHYDEPAHYHERVMAGVSGVTEPDGTATEIPHKLLFDGYADALREAIRCVKQVNGLV